MSHLSWTHETCKMTMILWVSLVMVNTEGCKGGRAPSRKSSNPTSQPARRPETPPEAAATPEAATLAQWVELAKQDLVRTLGISLSSIEVEEARYVTWPDGSLGCPEPDRMYTEALVPGGLIQLEAEGRHFRYHCADTRAPFHCPHPSGSPLPPKIPMDVQ